MPTVDFLTQVRSAFGFLEAEAGFALAGVEPPRAFDNARVEFQSPTLAITVGRERGQCFVVVGPVPAARYDLDLVCRILGDRAGQQIAEQERPELEELAAVLARHLADLERLCAPPERAATERRIKEAGEERAAALFGWAGGRRPAT